MGLLVCYYIAAYRREFLSPCGRLRRRTYPRLTGRRFQLDHIIVVIIIGIQLHNLLKSDNATRARPSGRRRSQYTHVLLQQKPRSENTETNRARSHYRCTIIYILLLYLRDVL